MSEVKRYDLKCYQSNSSGEWETYARMKASDSGDYVLHSDYEKLQAQLERAEESLNKAISSAEFFCRHADCRKDSWSCKCEFCKDTNASKKLREAREYFKKKEQK